MLRLVCFFVALYVGACLGAIGSAADGMPLLRAANENNGELVIRTATISFDAAIEDSPPSDEEVESRVVEIERDAQLLIDSGKMSQHAAKRLQQSLVLQRDSLALQVRQNAKRFVGGVFFREGETLGGDQLFEFQLKRGAEKSWGGKMVSVNRSLGRGRGESLVYDSAARVAVANTINTNVGISSLHLLGRLQGRLLSILPDEGIRAEIVEDESPAANGVILDIYKAIGQSEVKVSRISVDESRGWICPIVVDYDESGNVVQEWVCKDYFLHEESGLWYPSKSVYRSLSLGREAVVTVNADPNTTSFNQEIPKSRFLVPLPIGTQVVDNASDGMTRLVVDEVSIGIDDIAALGSIPQLSAVKVDAFAAKVPVKASWLFVYINFGLLVAFASWRLIKYRRECSSAGRDAR